MAHPACSKIHLEGATSRYFPKFPILECYNIAGRKTSRNSNSGSPLVSETAQFAPRISTLVHNFMFYPWEVAAWASNRSSQPVHRARWDYFWVSFLEVVSDGEVLARSWQGKALESDKIELYLSAVLPAVAIKNLTTWLLFLDYNNPEAGFIFRDIHSYL